MTAGVASLPSPWPARRVTPFRAGPHEWELGRRTLVIGILNCTPDSFSDGGACVVKEAISRRLQEIAEEGADIVDIGGESTRPGAEPVDADAEWKRILPALRAVRREGISLPVSVDTMKPEVARRAIDEGAVILNDVTGLRGGPAMAEAAARHGAAMILMHMQGEPRTMQAEPRYEDLIAEVRGFLAGAVETARDAGVSEESILVDPGIGFGKNLDHNLELLRRLAEFGDLGAGVLVGTSRKSFLGRLLDLPVDDRTEASIASFAGAVLAGAHAVRAHDIRAAVRAVRVADALRG